MIFRNKDQDFHYLIVVKPNALASSFFHKQDDLGESTDQWGVDGDNLLANPDYVDKAARTIRHFTEIIRAAKECLGTK